LTAKKEKKRQGLDTEGTEAREQRPEKKKNAGWTGATKEKAPTDRRGII
jgi:hypothetical protein